MKTIVIPQTKKIKLPDGSEKDFTFLNFCENALDLKVKGGGKQIRQVDKILKAIDGKEKDSLVELEDADAELLKEAIDSAEFIFGVARQVVEYYDVVKDCG